MKSPIVSPFGHHTNDTSPCATLSVMNKYRMSMCLVRLLLVDFPFLSKKNIAPVFLKKNVVQDSVSLSLQKIPCPTDLQDEVISAYQFSLCRATGVEFFCRTHNGKSSSQRQSSTGMPSRVTMDSKQCVHPPLQNTAFIGPENQR